MPEQLTPDHAWPNIGLVKTQRGVGTGFIVKGRYALTSLHVVKDAGPVLFKLKNEEYPVEIIKEFERNDLAVLQLPASFTQQLPVLPLGQLPEHLPVAYTTWGYRMVDDYRLLYGNGVVDAWLENDMLQLTTRSQRPGMSGCPVAIGARGGLKVVAVGYARYTAASLNDMESLAFAYAIKPILPEVIDYFGALAPEEKDNDIEKAISNLETLYEKPDRFLLWSRNGAACMLLTGAIAFWLWYRALHEAPGFMFAIVICCVLLVFLQIQVMQINNRNFMIRTMIALLRSSDPNQDVPNAYYQLLNSIKKS